MRFKTTRWMIPTYRFVGIAEGISYLVLLLIAMPLKYWADQPWMVSIVGAAHGGLFVAYLGIAMIANVVYRWPLIRLIQAFFASLVPLGTFWFDRKLKRLAEEMEFKEPDLNKRITIEQ